MTTISPLLRIGMFGVHIISCSGMYSFAGEVPAGIKAGGYKTEQEGIDAFVNWFKSQDEVFQRQYVADLRNDVFALVIAS